MCVVAAGPAEMWVDELAGNTRCTRVAHWGWAWGCPPDQNCWCWVRVGAPMPEHALQVLCHQPVCHAVGGPVLQRRNYRMCHILRSWLFQEQPCELCIHSQRDGFHSNLPGDLPLLNQYCSRTKVLHCPVQSLGLKSDLCTVCPWCHWAPRRHGGVPVWPNFSGQNVPPRGISSLAALHRSVLQPHTLQSSTCWTSFELTFLMPEHARLWFSLQY